MVATSVAIPPVATWARLRGTMRRPSRPTATPPAVDTVVVDRDGTIVIDVPYNGEPDRVEPMPGAREALTRLREHRLSVCVATNQSGIARGMLTQSAVDAVNAQVDALLGPFDAMFVCPHADDDRCECRKPAPGLVVAAARAVGTEPGRCVVIGDCAADVEAAHAAGARAILVPNERTREEEIRNAPLVAPDLRTAVAYVIAMAS
jgi:histidinol-phosphate phosphatase family protein